MNEIARLRTTMDGHDPANLRGDPMPGARYHSREFMQREWDGLWTRIWHVAGRVAELPEPGDYIVHDFMHESVIVVRQDDGSLRAFYNSCGHRGQRLAWDSGFTKGFHCPYHGWVWGRDGLLEQLPDPEDFPQGNPCRKRRLKELRCDSWGGLVWYTMSPDAPPLLEYLEPIPELYRNFPLERLVRVEWLRIALDTNWKFATENFAESYHTRTAHPQVPPFCDQDYWNARSEMFPRGHGRTVQPMRPSLRDRLPDGVTHPFDQMLSGWGIDPAGYPDFETKVVQGWRDLKAQKRKLWRERGYLHYERLDDEQLTDSLHTVIFPNVTLTFGPDQIFFMRTEPHPDDPGKCSFDLWCMVFPIAGITETATPMSGPARRPIAEAELVERSFDRGRGVPELQGGVVMQDLTLAEGQQRGLRSRGYEDAYLAKQETRVRYFHEVLNDYLEGRR